ncbi:RnfH family protein [Pseudomonas sp. R5(2019)]|uniref:RnfH family protein n=1 Tax=Pseudomonas sp. R5(2019) TaxID=2697566 RepID=UPI0014129F40|nr:RnfH family protein [Pseudomonas sp. R5(2019)]NBA96518.1 RnfH family protein [Pseudomonas sp. R5(2019)]
MAESLIDIEVVFATPERQLLLQVSVPSGTTLREAVRLSGIAEQFPEWDVGVCALGVFGRVIADAQTRPVEVGDRIEIYRPLLADPKEVRRLRAAKAAQARGGKS